MSRRSFGLVGRRFRSIFLSLVISALQVKSSGCTNFCDYTTDRDRGKVEMSCKLWVVLWVVL